jgi:hypothetical protein
MSVFAECVVLSVFGMFVLMGGAFFAALWQHEVNEL